MPCLYTNINLILPQGLVDLFHEEIPPETDIFNDYVFGIVACFFFHQNFVDVFRKYKLSANLIDTTASKTRQKVHKLSHLWLL